MKVVHLTNIPTPYRVAFFNILNDAFISRGWELFVVYCSLQEKRRDWEIKPDSMKYKWICLNAYPLHFKSHVIWLDFMAIFRIAKLNADILFTAGSWNMPAALCTSLPFPLLPKIKIFWSEGHSASVLHPLGPISWLRRRALSRYSFFAVPNKASQNFILSQLGFLASPINFISLPNVIDESIFGSRIAHFPADHVRKLLIVAALEERKGWCQFFSALSLLDLTVLSSIEFNVCGTGHLAQYICENFIALGCHFVLHGQVAPNVLVEIMVGCHGFMLPSLIDPNPLSAIEALCVGLPLLLSSKCGNHLECIEHGLNGWVFDPYEPINFAQCIISWSKTTVETLAGMCVNSQEIYRRNFQTISVVSSFCSSLNNVSKMIPPVSGDNSLL